MDENNFISNQINSLSCLEQLPSFLTQINEEKTTKKESIEKILNSLKVTQKCFSLITNRTTSQALKEVTQRFIRSILDATFIIEENLVENSFPFDELHLKMLKCVYDCLDLVACLLSFSSKKIKFSENNENEIINFHEKYLINELVSEIFDHEIVECVLWRRGAIRYMQAKEISKNKNRLNELNSNEVVESLNFAIEEFRKMRKVRGEQVFENIVSSSSIEAKTNPENVRVCLAVEMGIYSDSHLLGLVYEGELGIILSKILINLGKSEDDEEITFVREKALDALKQYIYLVDNEFAKAGWTHGSAAKLIKMYSKKK